MKKVFLCFLICTISLCVIYAEDDAGKYPPVNSFQWMNNRDIHLEDFKGQVVVIWFFTDYKS